MMQPIRPQHQILPLVSKEEILAYEEEKRRKEVEREQEMRRNNGGPIQLLHVEPEPEAEPQPKPEDLATTSRYTVLKFVLVLVLELEVTMEVPFICYTWGQSWRQSHNPSLRIWQLHPYKNVYMVLKLALES